MRIGGLKNGGIERKCFISIVAKKKCWGIDFSLAMYYLKNMVALENVATKTTISLGVGIVIYAKNSNAKSTNKIKPQNMMDLD